MVKKTFISLLKLLNLINYFNLVQKFFFKIFLLLKTTAKDKKTKSKDCATNRLTLRSFWMRLIADLCRAVRDRFAIVRQWICAFPLFVARRENEKLISSHYELMNSVDCVTTNSPLTCCTDVNFRSQRSSNGWVAAGSKSAVYCLIPPDVV